MNDHERDAGLDAAMWFKSGLEIHLRFDASGILPGQAVAEEAELAGFGLPQVKSEGQAISFDLAPYHVVMARRFWSPKAARQAGEVLGKSVAAMFEGVPHKAYYKRAVEHREPDGWMSPLMRRLFGPRVTCRFFVIPVR